MTMKLLGKVGTYTIHCGYNCICPFPNISPNPCGHFEECSKACTAYTACTSEVIPFQGLTISVKVKPRRGPMGKPRRRPKTFERLCKTYDNKCAYCGRERPLTRDHKIPLAKGGSNKTDNIVPSCVKCNLAKGDKTYDEFMPIAEEKKRVKEIRKKAHDREYAESLRVSS